MHLSELDSRLNFEKHLLEKYLIYMQSFIQ